MNTRSLFVFLWISLLWMTSPYALGDEIRVSSNCGKEMEVHPNSPLQGNVFPGVTLIRADEFCKAHPSAFLTALQWVSYQRISSRVIQQTFQCAPIPCRMCPNGSCAFRPTVSWNLEPDPSFSDKCAKRVEERFDGKTQFPQTPSKTYCTELAACSIGKSCGDVITACSQASGINPPSSPVIFRCGDWELPPKLPGATDMTARYATYLQCVADLLGSGIC